MLKKVACGLLAANLSVCSFAGPVYGESFFTVRRTFGALFLGTSGVLAKRAADFRRDANKTFEQYELASSARQAEDLFKRASDRDTKSQMSAGLSAVLLVSGLRLLLSSGADDSIPKIQRGLKSQKKDLAVQLNAHPHTGHVGVAITKGF